MRISHLDGCKSTSVLTTLALSFLSGVAGAQTDPPPAPPAPAPAVQPQNPPAPPAPAPAPASAPPAQPNTAPTGNAGDPSQPPPGYVPAPPSSQPQAPVSCNPPCGPGQQCINALCMVPAAPPSSAPPQESDAGEKTRTERSWGFSAKAGALLPGSAYVEVIDTDVDTSAGVLAVAKLDGYVAPKFSVGAQLLVAFPSIEDLDDSAFTLINVGPTLTAHFGSEAFMVSPGLAFSYQTMSAEALDDSLTGFSPGAFVELAFPFSKSTAGSFEVGFISQPVGGNDDTEVTFAPIFYLAAGLVFGG